MGKIYFTKENMECLVKEMLHDFYQGSTECWFSYLCNKSVYLGADNLMLVGEAAIKNYFKSYEGMKAQITEDVYYGIQISDKVIQVCGRMIIGQEDFGLCQMTFSFTLKKLYGKIRIICQQTSYEYIKVASKEIKGTVDHNTKALIRSLLVAERQGHRKPFKSGAQTVYIDLNTILYITSIGKKTEIVCLDQSIICNASISEQKETLGLLFYQVRRGYLVNTRYIISIERYEITLFTGITIQIPERGYKKLKEDLEQRIVLD